MKALYRLENPNAEENASEVIDRGSELVIDAGLFKIEWSAGNHLYFDGKKHTVKLGTLPEYKALTKQGEQGGARQPTTAQNSKPEGKKKKTKPDADGRSQ